MKKIAILLVFILLSTIAFSSSHAIVEDCKFKVTINLAFTGDGANEAYINKVKQAVNEKWNKDFKVGKCGCPFSVAINGILAEECDYSKEVNGTEYHCITVFNLRNPIRSHAHMQGWIHHKPMSHQEPYTPYSDSPSGPGKFNAQDAPHTIAHEIGHFMQLPDEYEDVYSYRVVDSNGNVVRDRVQIKPEDWRANGNSIRNNLPEGQRLEFYRNQYGGFNFSRKRSDVENDSIMAVDSPNVKVYQRHVDEIYKKSELNCPLVCCCGNGKVDSEVGEKCDPKANPDGCMIDFKCDKVCACKTIHVCGDGEKTGKEQCDYAAVPSGCLGNEFCSTNCICNRMSSENQTTTDIIPDDEVSHEETESPAEESRVLMEIVNPLDGQTIVEHEPVIIGYSDPGAVTLVEYLVDDELVYETEDPGLIWMIEPKLIGSGEHVLRVVATDIEMNEINEEVGFIIDIESH